MSNVFKYEHSWFSKLLAAAIVVIIAGMMSAGINGMVKNKNIDEMTASTVSVATYGKLPSLGSATAWLNSKPLTGNELRGKIVLVDFWTYSCINWRRSLPYIQAWAEKYKEKGLVVIGVHTPEFTFEKNIDNVRKAINEMNINYPVAIDNDYSVWRVFDNHYWPALYFADAKGNIRHFQFGEREYDQSEKIIQQLLREAGVKVFETGLVSVTAKGAEAAADWYNLKSQENYVGYERTENFASPGGAVPGRKSNYSSPIGLELNQWALDGEWTMQKNLINVGRSNGRIIYRFHARDLHLVMGPAMPGEIRFRVLIDGKAPGDAHGVDIDKDGNGIIKEQRMYQLIRQQIPINDKTFEIEFYDSGVEAFSFTFG